MMRATLVYNTFLSPTTGELKATNLKLQLLRPKSHDTNVTFLTSMCVKPTLLNAFENWVLFLPNYFLNFTFALHFQDKLRRLVSAQYLDLFLQCQTSISKVEVSMVVQVLLMAH